MACAYIRRLKSKSQSSGHVYKRKMHRFQKRTHSYLQVSFVT